MAARDAYHSKALAGMIPMTSSLPSSHLRMLPIFRISLNIQNDGTWRISFEIPCRAESDDVNTSCIEPPDVADYSYLIKYSKWRHVTHIIGKPLMRWVRWRHHFPRPPLDVADFSYLIKYSKLWHVTHIIRKPLPSWIRWSHHFPNQTSGCCQFFVSDQIFKMAARDVYHSKALAEMSPMTSSLFESNLRMSPIFCIWLNIQNGGTRRI